MVKECEKMGIARKDMLVVLDFQVNKDGIVPSLQDPPMFDVAPTQLYLDRSFPAEEPEWVKTAEDKKMHQRNIESRIRTIEDQCNRLTPMHTLFFIIFKGGTLCSKIE